MAYWRQQPKQKPRRPAAEVLQDREARRTAALAACISEMKSMGPEWVTHGLVAERVGVPVQFVRWKYPSIQGLLTMAESRPEGNP
jgi:DNA-binding transcriptional regulator YbjK